MKMRSFDETKAQNKWHSQTQTPNTNYLKAQSPKLELTMIQHCIVGYFHSVKEYPGLERKSSLRSAGPLREGYLNQSQITKNRFTISKLPEVLEKKMPSLFSNI